MKASVDTPQQRPSTRFADLDWRPRERPSTSADLLSQSYDLSGDRRLSDIAAKLLVVTCALNLNDVGSMILNVGQLFSTIMLAASIALIMARGKAALSASLVLFCVGVVVYVILATIFSRSDIDGTEIARYQLSYIATVLIVWAIAGYVGGLRRAEEVDQFLCFVRNAFLLTAASVWASPLLYQLYVNLPPGAEERLSGFFGNPNEASYASLLSLALVLNLPFRRVPVQISAITVAVGAIILTYSKSGMLILVAMVALHLFVRSRGVGRFLLVIAAVFCVVAIYNVGNVLRVILEMQIFDLSSYQQTRLQSVADVLSGRFDEETSTGRSALWALSIEKSWAMFPLGGGLGTFHHIVGGIIEGGVWQGSHNVFLMILGEAGVLPVLIISAALGGVVASSFWMPSRYRELSLMVISVLLLNMMSNHASLGARYHNLMLGVMFGFVCAVAGRGGDSVMPASSTDEGRGK